MIKLFEIKQVTFQTPSHKGTTPVSTSIKAIVGDGLSPDCNCFYGTSDVIPVKPDKIDHTMSHFCMSVPDPLPFFMKPCYS